MDVGSMVQCFSAVATWRWVDFSSTEFPAREVYGEDPNKEEFPDCKNHEAEGQTGPCGHLWGLLEAPLLEVFQERLDSPRSGLASGSLA